MKTAILIVPVITVLLGASFNKDIIKEYMIQTLSKHLRHAKKPSGLYLNMKAIFLLTAFILIGAPISAQAHHFNTTSSISTNDCYNKGVDAGMTAHGMRCPIVSENLTLDATFCSGYAFGDSVGDGASFLIGNSTLLNITGQQHCLTENETVKSCSLVALLGNPCPCA